MFTQVAEKYLLKLCDTCFVTIFHGIPYFTASTPVLLGPHTFLPRINTAGVKIRSALKNFMIIIS